MTGRTERIIHSGRVPLLRNASMSRSRLMAFLRRMPEVVRTSLWRCRASGSRSMRTIARGRPRRPCPRRTGGARHARRCRTCGRAPGSSSRRATISGSSVARLEAGDLVLGLADLLLEAIGLALRRRSFSASSSASICSLRSAICCWTDASSAASAPWISVLTRSTSSWRGLAQRGDGLLVRLDSPSATMIWSPNRIAARRGRRAERGDGGLCRLLLPRPGREVRAEPRSSSRSRLKRLEALVQLIRLPVEVRCGAGPRAPRAPCRPCPGPRPPRPAAAAGGPARPRRPR